MKLLRLRKLFAGLLTFAVATSSGFTEETKKLILIAGKPSHGPGLHEFNAGSILFKKCLEGIEGLEVEVHNNGWVSDDKVLETADAIVIYADGGGGHPALQGNHRELLQKAVDRGAGMMMMHYALECAPDDLSTGGVFREWIGGVYEKGFSVNPIWNADYKSFPGHPITNGVEPFSIEDEWYFSIHFAEDEKSIQSLLVAVPSDETRDGPYVYPKGPYPHIQARNGEEETMMWCKLREDGGRGVGFTGGHFHKNWANDNFRKIALNAMLWIAKIDVPETGVVSTVTEHEMAANIDHPKNREQ